MSILIIVAVINNSSGIAVSKVSSQSSFLRFRSVPPAAPTPHCTARRISQQRQQQDELKGEEEVDSLG